MFTRTDITLIDHGRLSEPEPSRDCVDCLLDVREAARLLNCSTKWIYLNYDRLPYVALGSGPKPRLRFRRKALLTWIEQREIDWRKK